MNKLLKPILMSLRLDFLVVLALGAMLWTGYAGPLVLVHMILGALLVLQAWMIAAIAARAHAAPGRVLLVAVWGLIVLAVGGMQTQWLPGSLHWIIRVIHLLLGLSLVAQVEILAMKTRRAAEGG
jgi:hypothetical protein